MFRHSLTKTARPVSLLRSSFSTSTRIMAGGDTGAPRSGGAASADAFTKREKGQEDYAIREREKLKLQELLAKVHESEKHLSELKNHVKTFSEQQAKNEEGEKK